VSELTLKGNPSDLRFLSSLGEKAGKTVR